jgi:hypothetical protein
MHVLCGGLDLPQKTGARFLPPVDETKVPQGPLHGPRTCLSTSTSSSLARSSLTSRAVISESPGHRRPMAHRGQQPLALELAATPQLDDDGHSPRTGTATTTAEFSLPRGGTCTHGHRHISSSAAPLPAAMATSRSPASLISSSLLCS